jgi:hypothetical protein
MAVIYSKRGFSVNPFLETKIGVEEFLRSATKLAVSVRS